METAGGVADGLGGSHSVTALMGQAGGRDEGDEVDSRDGESVGEVRFGPLE